MKVDSDNVPSSTGPAEYKNDKTNKKKDKMSFKEKIYKSFSECASGVNLNSYDKAKSNIRTMKREFRECNNEKRKNI